MRTISSMAVPVSNATVSTLYGNRCGVSDRLNQEALGRDCSMLTGINRVALDSWTKHETLRVPGNPSDYSPVSPGYKREGQTDSQAVALLFS